MDEAARVAHLAAFCDAAVGTRPALSEVSSGSSGPRPDSPLATDAWVVELEATPVGHAELHHEFIGLITA